MSNIAEAKNFQERMFERIREQMGDLLSEEELKKIVDTSIHKAFFEQTVTADGYGRTTTSDPHFVKLMRSLMEDNIKAMMEAWIAENQEVFDKAIQDAIAQGMYGLVQRHFEAMVKFPLQTFADNLRSQGIRC